MPVPTDQQPMSVVVPAAAFTGGYLPSICVVSGRPATTGKTKTVENPVGLAWLGILGGLIILVIVRAITKKSVTGAFPLDPAAAKKAPAFRAERRRNVSIAGLLLLASLGSCGAGSAVDQHSGAAGGLLVIGVLLFIVSPVWLLYAMRSPLETISAKYDPDRKVVIIKHAHPAFAAAVAAGASHGGAPSPYTAYQPAGLPSTDLAFQPVAARVGGAGHDPI